jgi:uncharacterized membrane protein YagU involved in acid resistance
MAQVKMKQGALYGNFKTMFHHLINLSASSVLYNETYVSQML